MTWPARFQAALNQQHAAGAYRQRRVRAAADAPYVTVDGRRYLHFAGNDYLGLSQAPAVISAWQQAAAEYGVGSTASGHVLGHTVLHQQLEDFLAQWQGYPRALLFGSGFAANQAVLFALLQAQDRVLADKLCHASLLEAAMLAPASLRRYPHQDVAALSRLLVARHPGQTLVVTEGVFSMDGDAADLQAVQAACRAQQAWLMVDDAHGFGLLGPEGRGSAAAAGVQPDVLVLTFGKAAGVSGAAVLCDELTAEYLLQKARHLIYSTAMPPAQAGAILAAVQAIQTGEALRQRVRDHVAYFQAALAQTAWGAALLPSQTPIQPLLCGSNERVLAVAAALRARGIWVAAIRPPTVPPNSARLRITLTAAHSRNDIDTLLEGLADVAA